jgi:hypothetical protein
VSSGLDDMQPPPGVSWKKSKAKKKQQVCLCVCVCVCCVLPRVHDSVCQGVATSTHPPLAAAPPLLHTRKQPPAHTHTPHNHTHTHNSPRARRWTTTACWACSTSAGRPAKTRSSKVCRAGARVRSLGAAQRKRRRAAAVSMWQTRRGCVGRWCCSCSSSPLLCAAVLPCAPNSLYLSVPQGVPGAPP